MRLLSWCWRWWLGFLVLIRRFVVLSRLGVWLLLLLVLLLIPLIIASICACGGGLSSRRTRTALSAVGLLWLARAGWRIFSRLPRRLRLFLCLSILPLNGPSLFLDGFHRSIVDSCLGWSSGSYLLLRWRMLVPIGWFGRLGWRTTLRHLNRSGGSCARCR
jgi:hypothetical protein